MKRTVAFIISFLAIIAGITIIMPFDQSVFVKAEDSGQTQYVAEINQQGYESFLDAISDANNSTEEEVTIYLLQDVVISSTITINKKISIVGSHSFIRSKDDTETTVNENFSGTLFTVNSGASLTLNGGLTIDGSNNWVFKETEYKKELDYITRYHSDEEFRATAEAPKDFDGYSFVVPEEGAPTATAPMFNVSGELVIYNTTIKNNLGKSGNGSATLINLVKDKGSLILNGGAKILHNATSHRGTVLTILDETTVEMNDGAEICGNYSAYNGGCIYNNGGTMTMNGGKINNNYAVRTNGTVTMLYQNNATFIMKGGEICGNSGLKASGAGHCCPIYLHSTGIMEMTGGSVCHNIGMTVGGIMAMNKTSKLTISGGYVGNNTNVLAGEANKDYSMYDTISECPDILNLATTVILGGTFAQDVTDLCAPEYYYEYDEETQTGSVNKCPGHIYKDTKCSICQFECPSEHTVIANNEDKTIHVFCNGECKYDATIRLEAPQNLTYTGNEKSAVLYGEVVGMSDITYNTADGKAPIEIGEYTATITCEGETISVDFSIVESTPIINIALPTQEILPDKNLTFSLSIFHESDENAQNLPTDFVLKYRIDNEETLHEINGLELMLPSDLKIGQKVYVYVETAKIDDKYTEAQSNVIELTVGEVYNKVEEKPETNKSNLGLILGIIAIVLFVIASVVTVFIIWYIKVKKKTKK